MFFSFFFSLPSVTLLLLRGLCLSVLQDTQVREGKKTYRFFLPSSFFFPPLFVSFEFSHRPFFFFVCLFTPPHFFFPLFRLFEGTIVFPFFFLPLIPFSFFAYAYQHPQSMTPSQQLFRCFYGLLEKKKKRKEMQPMSYLSTAFLSLLMVSTQLSPCFRRRFGLIVFFFSTSPFFFFDKKKKEASGLAVLFMIISYLLYLPFM